MRISPLLLLFAAASVSGSPRTQEAAVVHFRRTIQLTEAAALGEAHMTLLWKIVHEYRVEVSTPRADRRVLKLEITRVHGWMAHGEEGEKARFDSRAPRVGPARGLVETVGKRFEIEVDARGRAQAVRGHAAFAMRLPEAKLLLHYEAPAPTDANLLAYWQQLFPGSPCEATREAPSQLQASAWLYGHLIPIEGRVTWKTSPDGEWRAEREGKLGGRSETDGPMVKEKDRRPFAIEEGRHRGAVRLAGQGLPLEVSTRIEAQGIHGLTICFNLGGPPLADDVRLVHETRFERVPGDQR